MRITTFSGWVDLGMWILAPISGDSSIRGGPLNMDVSRAIIGSFSPASLRIVMQVLTPPMPGMIGSQITTFGRFSMNALTPSFPSDAVITSKPLLEKAYESNLRKNASSSLRRIVVAVRLIKPSLVIPEILGNSIQFTRKMKEQRWLYDGFSAAL